MRWLAMVLVFFAMTVPAVAQERAQNTSERGSSAVANGADGEEVALVPLPRAELDPVFTIEAHLSVFGPLARAPLCPDETLCVFGGGAGLGASLGWLFPSGIHFAITYDTFLIDSAGLYDLGAMTAIGARFSKLFLLDSRIHPLAGVGVSLVTLSDGIFVDSVGLMVEGVGGAEFELTHYLSLSTMIRLGAFTTTAFTTTKDNVARAQDFGININLSVQVGLTFTLPR